MRFAVYVTHTACYRDARSFFVFDQVMDKVQCSIIAVSRHALENNGKTTIVQRVTFDANSYSFPAELTVISFGV